LNIVNKKKRYSLDGILYMKMKDREQNYLTVACVQGTSKLRILKRKDAENGFYFDMASKPRHY
jgi:hypothetical protein